MADPGSFRDPSSRVFIQNDRIIRGLDDVASADFAVLESSRLFEAAMLQGEIVATKRLGEVPQELQNGVWMTALEHERVPMISYPYEWSFEMLKDAALLQLDLTERALAEQMITKDATPFNIQFIGSHPVFIDVGSFERLTPGEPWFGYRQFCQQFLNPLLLQARRGVDFRPWVRGSLDGMSPDQCASMLRLSDRCRPATFVHVVMHAWADRRLARSPRDVRSELSAAGFGPKVIAAQVRKLRTLVAGLRWRPGASAWTEYSTRNHYADAELASKADFVKRAAGRRRRTQVLDLGANDGFFTEIVLAGADSAVAVDSDPAVVDGLYRRLRDRTDRRLLPLCVDLVDAAGGHGWRGTERAPFDARVRPDLVLCLALVHHLAITENVPLEEVAAFLAQWRSEVIVEFPALDDPMVRRLVQQKKGRSTKRYSQAQFEAAIERHFVVQESLALQSGNRIMYSLRPRSDERPSAGTPKVSC